MDFLEKSIASIFFSIEGRDCDGLVTNQKAAIFILTDVRTSNLTVGRIVLQINIWGPVHNMGLWDILAPLWTPERDKCWLIALIGQVDVLHISSAERQLRPALPHSRSSTCRGPYRSQRGHDN
jgi:predicted metal-dependent enzyme (double-stranded beta helix superfamily)